MIPSLVHFKAVFSRFRFTLPLAHPSKENVTTKATLSHTHYFIAFHSLMNKSSALLYAER